MSSVTFPTALGGDGSTVSDDADPTTGLRNAGYKTRFVPALQQTINVVQTGVNKAAAAAASEAVTVTKAAEARASELAAAGYANEAMLLSLGVETLRPSIKPSLLLDFARAQVVPPSVTFTRTSTATRVGPSGLIETVGINVPRLDYDPITRACLGLLVEEQRTNLALRSEEFDNASWAKINSTVSANASASPSGSVSADKIIGSTAGVSAIIRQSISVTAGVSYVFGIFCKSAEADSISLYGQNQGLGGFKNFNLTGLDFKAAANGQVSFGSGYKFIYIVTSAATTGTGTFNIEIPGSEIVSAGVDGLFIWGAQIETGAFPTSYIPTTTASVTRAQELPDLNVLSPWYRGDQGTFFAEFSVFGVTAISGNPRVIGANGSVAPIFYNSTSVGAFDAAISRQIAVANILNGQAIKAASSYTATLFNVTVNASVGVDVAHSGSLGTRTVINLGSTPPMNGHIRKIAYYPQRLSNAQLQALTTL